MLFNVLRKLIVSSLFFVFYSTSHATTICAYNCLAPSPGAGSGDDISELFEWYSVGDTNITINAEGIIFLDINLYNSFSALTISSTTDLYTSLNDVPDSLGLPASLELVRDAVGLGGDASFEGGELGNYVFLMDFNEGDSLNLSTTAIVLVDGAALTAVPVPAALWLFGSGVFSLLMIGKRRKRKL